MNLPTAQAEALMYAIGDTVYHKTEPDQPGIITSITFAPGSFTYCVQWSRTTKDYHYQFELSAEKGIS